MGWNVNGMWDDRPTQLDNIASKTLLNGRLRMPSRMRSRPTPLICYLYYLTEKGQ